MIYGNDTRLLLADVGIKFERVDMQMIRWMCGVSMKEKSELKAEDRLEDQERHG